MEDGDQCPQCGKFYMSTYWGPEVCQCTHGEDIDFDKLNEGLMTSIIIAQYERDYPEPPPFAREFESYDDEQGFTEEWITWREKLVDYAEGWRACLEYQVWFKQWQKDLDRINYLVQWVLDNPTDVIAWRWYRTADPDDRSEGVMGWFMEQMVPIDIPEEEWAWGQDGGKQ